MAKWTPLKLAAGDRQIARLRGAAGEQHRVVLLAQLVRSSTFTPTFALQRNSTPSASICSNPPPDAALFQLEIGNAVHQQSARPIGPLEDRDADARPD